MQKQSFDMMTGSEIPGWVPVAALNYLDHTEDGISIRALARQAGCHASTILRQVRRLETMRDDLLIDDALKFLSGLRNRVRQNEQSNRTMVLRETEDDLKFQEENRRVLRRLCEPGAVLAVAAEMDKAVIVRDDGQGSSVKTAVVDRSIAMAMALRDWITCQHSGRISRYHITAAGRTALNHLTAEVENHASGFSEAPAVFEAAEKANFSRARRSPGAGQKRIRYGISESPLVSLARRKDKDGNPFLSEDLVGAGERLREDFELAQMGPRVTQNWDMFLTGRTGETLDGGMKCNASGARARVAGALEDLGPGLGDVVLRCCCYLEGLETAEKKMGWSARSGKIVLRIALQRLKRHYDMLGQSAGLIS